MNPLLVSTLFVFIGIYSLENLKVVNAEKSCKAIMADITKRQLSGIGSCTKTLKLKNSKEKTKKINCIMKCAMENEGLVGRSGEISWEIINPILIKEFPPSLLDRANVTFQPCIEKFTGTLDANPETDPFCKTYDPLVKCLLGALTTLCNFDA